MTFTYKEHKIINMRELRKYRCPKLFLGNLLELSVGDEHHRFTCKIKTK